MQYSIYFSALSITSLALTSYPYLNTHRKIFQLHTFRSKFFMQINSCRYYYNPNIYCNRSALAQLVIILCASPKSRFRGRNADSCQRNEKRNPSDIKLSSIKKFRSFYFHQQLKGISNFCNFHIPLKSTSLPSVNSNRKPAKVATPIG